MSKQEIREFVKERKIPVLLHFTRLSHLPSILKRGIQCRDGFERLTTIPGINDEPALFEYEDRVSVSLAHPDSKAFAKFRDVIGGEWCVIGISPDVLWQQDCLFCKHRADDKRIRTLKEDALKSVESFKEMFEEIPDHQSRSDQFLNGYDPTDEQAEVLVLDSIRSESFVGIVFPTLKSRMNYQDKIGGLKAMAHGAGKGYFLPRALKRVTGG